MKIYQLRLGFGLGKMAKGVMLMGRRATMISIAVLGAVDASTVCAHSFQQKVAAYSDDQGLARSNYQTDFGFDFEHQGADLSASNYKINYSHERVQDRKALTSDAFYKDRYGAAGVAVDSMGVNASYTWSRLTDTRLMTAFAKDQAVHSRTLGTGISRWFFHETLQGSADVSQTLVERPPMETLGSDSDLIVPPPVSQKTGVTLGLKHLATPTTIANYSATRVRADDRPDLSAYTASMKQYIPWTHSAIHGSGSRVFNRGEVDNRTDYGPIDATILEVAWLQELGALTTARLGYRWFREDETTKSATAELTRGSDTISLNLAQRINRMTFELAYASYLTNEVYRTTEKRRGQLVEAGIKATL